MTDVQALRFAMSEHPMSTAAELCDMLQWEPHRMRRIMCKLLERGETASHPKRYSLTSLGDSRMRHAELTDDERAERRRQRIKAYNAMAYARRAPERAAAKKARAEARAQAKELVETQRVRIVAAPLNDGLVNQALANRDPLAMAWGGTCNVA